MNTKLLQDQQALLAIASKTVQRSTLFLQACAIIQEQQSIIQRLSAHVGELSAELLKNETALTTAGNDPAIPATTPGKT